MSGELWEMAQKPLYGVHTAGVAGSNPAPPTKNA
jgi:hypothetical protein